MMFQEYRGYIYIFQHSDDLLFICSLPDFLRCEPDYQAASKPIRIWDSRRYLSDGNNEFDDNFFTEERLNLYLSRVSYYQQQLEIIHYTHPDLVQEELFPSLMEELFS